MLTVTGWLHLDDTECTTTDCPHMHYWPGGAPGPIIE